MAIDDTVKPEDSLEYVRIKHAESPRYLIEEFSVTEADSFYFYQRCQAQNLPAQCIRPGIYVHLLDKQKDEVVMSNIPAEIYDHTEICQKSYGWVLICGLGLGMILHQLCRNDHISEIVVVEKESEIIDMIAPAFPEGKVTILQGDAFLPEECGITGQFDTMFFDIWNNITSQTYSEMQTLSALWKNWQSQRIQILHRKEKLAIEVQKRQKFNCKEKEMRKSNKCRL